MENIFNDSTCVWGNHTNIKNCQQNLNFFPLNIAFASDYILYYHECVI